MFYETVNGLSIVRSTKAGPKQSGMLISRLILVAREHNYVVSLQCQHEGTGEWKDSWVDGHYFDKLCEASTYFDNRAAKL